MKARLMLVFLAVLNILSFFVMLYQVWKGMPGQLKYVNLILNPLAAAWCAYVASVLGRMGQ